MPKNISSAKDFPAGFYVVATPIGNLRDITLRALDVLAAASFILAEDTRRTRKLLSHYEIKSKKLRTLHDHSSAKAVSVLAEIISENVRSGEVVAFVSDAGTPLISDPGLSLLRCLIDGGIPVFPVPGACSVIAALSIAGLPAHIFTFAGFLPPRQKARLHFLQNIAAPAGAIVFFETAPRLCKSLADMISVFGADCPALIAREMTKIFEEKKRGALGALAAFYQKSLPPKGEITIIISPANSRDESKEKIAENFLEKISHLSSSQAAAALARQTGLSRADIYRQLVAQKKKSKNGK